jgi:hypothetical protein
MILIAALGNLPPKAVTAVLLWLMPDTQLWDENRYTASNSVRTRHVNVCLLLARRQEPRIP